MWQDMGQWHLTKALILPNGGERLVFGVSDGPKALQPGLAMPLPERNDATAIYTARRLRHSPN